MELPKSPQRILVVQTGNIREVLASLPFLVLLRTRFPQAELACLVEENAAEMMHGHWTLDRLLTARQAWQYSYLQASLLRKRLRHFAPNLAFDLHNTLRSGLAMWMSRAPHRISSSGIASTINGLFLKRQFRAIWQFGFGIAEPSRYTSAGGFGYTEPNPAQHCNGFSNRSNITTDATDLVRKFMSLLEVVGVDGGSIHFDLPEWERDHRVAREVCRQRKMADDFVLMSVSAAAWQHAEYTHLVHYLKSQWNLPALLVAENPAALSLTETIAAITGSPFVVGNNFALSELAALARLATAYIGPDTHLFALAVATKTPAVATHSATNFATNFLSACDECLNEITRQREQTLPLDLPLDIGTRKIAAA